MWKPGFNGPFFGGLQGFLACKTEEFDFDMDGEKAPICYKEITTALRQWILPTFVSLMTLSSICPDPCVYDDQRRFCLYVGEEDEDVNPQAPVCTSWPPGGPAEPDPEKAGQAAGLRSDLWQTEPELRGTGCGQHVQVGTARGSDDGEFCSFPPEEEMRWQSGENRVPTVPSHPRSLEDFHKPDWRVWNNCDSCIFTASWSISSVPWRCEVFFFKSGIPMIGLTGQICSQPNKSGFMTRWTVRQIHH